MKYFPINWQDGMKIHKDHFVGMENAFLEQLQLQEKIDLTRTNFGLISTGRNQSSLEMSHKIDEHSLSITISSCKAISPGGALFWIEDPNQVSPFQVEKGRLMEELSKSNALFVILISAPFDRIPTGNPDPEEVPLRRPFTRPTYRIEISHTGLESQSDAGQFQIPVGRILMQDGEPTLDKNYIPPSRTNAAFSLLSRLTDSWTASLEKLEKLGRETQDRIHSLQSSSSSDDLFGNKVELGDHGSKLNMQMLTALSDLLPILENQAKDQSPYQLFVSFQQFARKLINGFYILDLNARKTWENYLAEAIKQDNYLKAAQKLVDHKFEQLNISSTVVMIRDLIKSLLLIYDRETGLPKANFAWQTTNNIGTIDIGENPDTLDLF